MKSANWYAGVGVLVLALSGCGGGGGGGSEVAATPPPPNTSLTDLKSSETFAALAFAGLVNLPKDGSASASSLASNTLTARYDAGNKGYTISVADRSQTFLPADINASLGSGRPVTVYVKTSGGTTDTLTLTKAGTSGRNYEFIGAGFWQRMIDGTSSTSGSLDAFLFGFSSAGGAIPRSGRAEYAVDLIGAETTADAVFPLTGTGLSQVDFTSGTIITHGNLGAVVAGSTVFSSEARLSSSGEAFNGTFRFNDSGLFSGTLNGRFFGPQAQEIGGVFSASSGDGRIAVGSLLGRGGNVTATNASVAAPVNNEFFTNDAVRIAATLDGASGALSQTSEGQAALIVNYDSTRQRYTLLDGDRSRYFGTLASTDGNISTALNFLAPTGYQYVRGGEWRQAQTTGGVTRYLIDDFTFGAETRDAALPRTGSAGYATEISGTAADGDFDHPVSFAGQGSVTANFASSAIVATGNVHFTDEAPGGPVAVANGVFNATGSLSSSSNLFSASGSLDGIGLYSGSIDGRFYGPAAEEIGGAFHFTDGAGGVMSGVLAGKQDADVVANPPSNISLVNARYDENFVNISATGTASFPKNGSAGAAALAQDPLTVSYDAQSDGYTLRTVSQRTQLFLPADIDAAQSSTRLAVYALDNRTPEDLLTLTRPGTSGRNYEFAGAGLWQRTTDGATSLSQSFDAFIFGIPTLDIAVPRTGRAEYAVDVLGVETTATSAALLNGTGQTQIDFATGTVITHGSFAAPLSGTTTFSSEARLSSLNGTLTGNFRFDDLSLFSGTLDGRLFGPQAQEIGAVFSATSGDGRVAAGTIVGRGSAVTATNASLVAPTVNEFFTNDAVRLSGTLATATSSFSQATVEVRPPLIVNYDATRQKYTLVAPGHSHFFGSLSSTVGNMSQNLGFVAPADYRYARGAEWREALTASGAVEFTIHDFTFGVETPDTAMPRTGIAGYAAQISGSAVDGDYQHLVSFSGRGTVTVNFATGALRATGGVRFVDETPLGAVTVANGAFAASGFASTAANGFSGSASLTGIGSYSGGIYGRFYGPAAEELGGAFHLSDGAGGGISGLLLGQQDPDVVAVLPSLATVSQTTIFDNSRYLVVRSGATTISSASLLAYDPASSTYTFNATGDSIPLPVQFSFGPGQKDIAGSDASYTRYESAGSSTEPAYTATVLNSGAGNPTIALTYTSFADIDFSTTSGGVTVESRYYYPFGINTPTVQLPQSGTGTYEGMVYGRGRVINGLNQTTRYTLSEGTSKLSVDFGAGTFTSQLIDVKGTALVGAGTVNFGSYSAEGSIGANGVMAGNFNAGATGSFRGSFFGPDAAEYGAVFTVNKVETNRTTTLNGVVVGERTGP